MATGRTNPLYFNGDALYRLKPSATYLERSATRSGMLTPRAALHLAAHPCIGRLRGQHYVVPTSKRRHPLRHGP